VLSKVIVLNSSNFAPALTFYLHAFLLLEVVKNMFLYVFTVEWFQINFISKWFLTEFLTNIVYVYRFLISINQNFNYGNAEGGRLFLQKEKYGKTRNDKPKNQTGKFFSFSRFLFSFSRILLANRVTWLYQTISFKVYFFKSFCKRYHLVLNTKLLVTRKVL